MVSKTHENQILETIWTIVATTKHWDAKLLIAKKKMTQSDKSLYYYFVTETATKREAHQWKVVKNEHRKCKTLTME